jgi:hypothetical protein
MKVLFGTASVFPLKELGDERADNLEDWAEKFEELGETFLNDVFNVDGKLDRDVFEDRVCDNAAWVFKSDKIRAKLGLKA